MTVTLVSEHFDWLGSEERVLQYSNAVPCRAVWALEYRFVPLTLTHSIEQFYLDEEMSRKENSAHKWAEYIDLL